MARIVSLVGKGGMGEVYRADDLKLDHTVALKFLPRDLARDAQRLEYFHSEVRLTRQIIYPNVCRVYDIGETTIQSDLYSLGLILYELFTGNAVYKTGSIPELLRQHEESSRSQPSTLVDDLDPSVERGILRCLEKEPQHRPRSVLAVATALPGGDPLAAALAANETPSPEMVAAAGGTTGFTPRVALASLFAVGVALVLACVIAQQAKLVNHLPFELAPEVLEDRATQIIAILGYDRGSADSAFGFEFDYNDRREIDRFQDSDTLQNRIDALGGGKLAHRRFDLGFRACGLMCSTARHADTCMPQ